MYREDRGLLPGHAMTRLPLPVYARNAYRLINVLNNTHPVAISHIIPVNRRLKSSNRLSTCSRSCSVNAAQLLPIVYVNTAAKGVLLHFRGARFGLRHTAMIWVPPSR